MIQRVQSLYLLAVLVVGLLVFFFNPSYAILKDSKNDKKVTLGYTKTTTYQLSRSNDPGVGVSKNLNYLFLLVISLGAGAAIFLYKNSSLQKKVCIYLTLLNIIFSIMLLLDYQALQKQLADASAYPGITAIIPIAFMVCTFLAWNHIRRDENLLKSMDRLR